MTSEALAYFKSLIRESFDKADIQQRQEIIDTIKSFGMDELEGFVNQLLKDLKADL